MYRSDIIDLSHIEDPRLVRLADYWRDKRRDRPVPYRGDIDPVDFPRLLPNVWLVHYEPESGRFLYRLAGEEIRNVHPGIAFGRYMDEFMTSESFARIAPRYRTVLGLDGGDPAIMHMRGFVYRLHQHRLTAVGERLVLPLLDDDGEPRFIFGATLYQYDSGHQTVPAEEPPLTVTPVPLNRQEKASVDQRHAGEIGMPQEQ